MIYINKNLLIKIFFLIIIVIANLSGILKLIGGSAFAEGITITTFTILMLILLVRKKILDWYDYLMIIIALYSFIITIMHYLIGNIELGALISLYSYIIPCLIFLNKDNYFLEKNTNLYFKTFFIMLAINSAFSIYQVINPNSFLPLDAGIRASGLMKSTLNFSGILTLFTFPALVFNFNNNFFKYILWLLLLIGSILSMSRGLFASIFVGYIISFPIQIILMQKISKKILKRLLCYVLCIFLACSIFVFILDKLDLIENFERLLHIIDYKNDTANVDRLNFWKSFGKYFCNNPFGYGVGQLVSGTTFVKNAIDFESYILGTLYSIGFLGFLYFLIPIFWVYNKLKNVKSCLQQYMIMFLSCIIFQNLIQAPMLTPTTLIFTWLTIIFFTNYLKNYDTK